MANNAAESSPRVPPPTHCSSTDSGLIATCDHHRTPVAPATIEAVTPQPARTSLVGLRPYAMPNYHLPNDWAGQVISEACPFTPLAGPRPHGDADLCPTEDRARQHFSEVFEVHTNCQEAISGLSSEAYTTEPTPTSHDPPDPDSDGEPVADMLDAHQSKATTALYSSPPYDKWPSPSRNMDPEAAALYDAALSARVNGRPPVRLDHTTDLVTHKWQEEATGHANDAMILQGITHGFPIQYVGPPGSNTPAKYNHQSARAFASSIDQYVDMELKHRAISGPYDTPPFHPWFVSSPLMSREKSSGEGRRVIVNLSYPEGGVNQHIPPRVFNGQDVHHNLPTIAAAVTTIAAKCPGEITLAVIDLSRAYRQFPVYPLDWPLLGIFWRGAWSFDRRLPFGCRMSSYIMQSVADFIVRALAAKNITIHMYLDDIIMISPSRATADRDYNIAMALLARLGLAVAHKKLQPPAPAVTWLGIRIDMPANRLSIHQEKLDHIKSCMAAASRRDFLTKKHLQRLIGLANHLAKIVPGAQIFIARLLAALRSATGDIIRVTREVRSDLAWYARHLSASNGKAIIPCRRVVRRIWADACLKGAGASDGTHYYEHVFTGAFTRAHHIAHLEALNCLAAVRLFVDQDAAGGIVEVMCDNKPSTDAFASGRARDEVLAACTRALWFAAAARDVDLVFTHVPGEGMSLPDALSRASLDAAARARADALIENLSLRYVTATQAHFSYKSFM